MEQKNFEKQAIEEMAMLISGNEIQHCGHRDVAERLYTAGYRKQKEGEWIEEVRFIRDGKVLLRHYKCNLCGVYLATQANFCPNCGAKMKGASNDRK